MQEADRLWVPSKALLERPKTEVNPVAVPSAYLEFDLVMDGIGGSGDCDGILGGLIRQLDELSRSMDLRPGLDIDKALRSLNITVEEAHRISRWLTRMGVTVALGLPWGLHPEKLHDPEMLILLAPRA
jgi:hypothetical protein